MEASGVCLQTSRQSASFSLYGTSAQDIVPATFCNTLEHFRDVVSPTRPLLPGAYAKER